MAGLVVFEGIDGCGKSTVAKEVVRRLGDRAVLTREPTDSWVGRAVKEGDGKEVSPYTDALLFMADRAQHTLEMADMVRRGRLVVCDRYYHSTVAYQTASLRRKGLGDNFAWLLDANMRISLRPDITFLLSLPPEKMPERISDRAERSRFERLDFLEEVDQNYRRLAESDTGIVVIDATRPLEDVVERVLKTIEESNI
ncbi:MAG: dTMP kinase [Thermoplasmata archaeon]